MAMFQFGAGVQSNPMDAYNESVNAIKQPRLAKLLSEAYGAQDEGQRRSLLQQLVMQDPTMGMQAAKMLDPRMKLGDTPAQQQYAEWLLKNAPPEHRDQVLGVLGGYKARPSGAAIQYKDGEDEYGNPIVRAFDPNNVGGQVVGTGQSYGAPVGTGQRMPAGGMQPPGMPPQMPPQQQNAPNRGGMESDIALANAMAQAGIDPAQIDALLASRGQRAEAQPANFVPPQPQSRPWTQNTPNPYGNAAPGFIGRRKEDETAAVERAKAGVQIENMPLIGQLDATNAARTESAKQDVQIGNMPRVGQLEADAAALKAEAETAAKLRAEVAGKIRQRARDDRESLMLLSTAAGLLKTATSGGAQEMWKGANRYFGNTTEGAKADAKLNLVAGKLVGKVPRFEGPQSNIDVQIYQTMAGDLSNPNKTRGERIAAAQGMIDLIKKYQDYTQQQGSPQQPASGGKSVVRTGTQNGRKVVQYSDGSVDYAD